VALRDFQKDELIMVERPILKFSKSLFTLPRIDQIEPSAQPAALALTPEDSDFFIKFMRNSMEYLDTNESGLFITLSRVNHDCFGNTEHCYLENRDMKTLVACRAIECGEEVTMSYLDIRADYVGGRQQHLLRAYRFTCNCSVCTNPAQEADLEEVKKLDHEIPVLARQGNNDMALRKGQVLLALYDKLNMSLWFYHRTYFDLFQIASFSGQGLAAQKYVRCSYEFALAASHDEWCSYVLKPKMFLVEQARPRRQNLVADKK
jgi:SET domain